MRYKVSIFIPVGNCAAVLFTLDRILSVCKIWSLEQSEKTISDDVIFIRKKEH